MNNQKDTQKTNINIYGESNVSNNKLLSNMPVYEFANKKTEKLVTALYMITDCMDTDDALKGKLRLLGVELLSDIYKLSTLSPMDKHTYISVSLTHIYELLSFIEIAYTIGFISEMNTEILKKEFSFLASELESYQTKDKHFTFTLDEKMFSVRQGLAKDNNIKDMSHANAGKRTSSNTMPARPIGVSFMNKESLLQDSQFKKTNYSSTNLAEREERSRKIISLIKDKTNLSTGEAGISIKDISLAFTDCSEKTIQRELNSLILKGQLRKKGAKRWSRYQLGSSS